MIGLVDLLRDRSRRRFDLGRAPADALTLEVGGGWTLPLSRLHGRRDREPVILCHGFGGNGRSFDLPGLLGPYLASRGLDVYVVELRTTAAATPPSEAARAAVSLAALEGDVVAMAELVADRNGRAPAWIGHSLGGALALCAAGRAPIAKIVGLGASLWFEGNERLRRSLGLGLKIARSLGKPYAPQAMIGALEAPIMGRFEWPRALSWVSPSGIDGELLRALHAVALEDLPVAILEELVGWVDQTPESPAEAMRARAATCRAEVLFMAGSDDDWAPIEAVQRTARSLGTSGAGGAEVEVLDAAATGVDYNHASMLFGRHRERDVFGRIEVFVGGSR